MRQQLSAFVQGLRAIATTAAVGGLGVVCLNVNAVEVNSLDLAFIADSNPSKAQFDRDIFETNSLRLGVNASLFSKEIDDTSSIEFDARVAFESNSSVEELGESIYTVGFGYFKEFEESRGVPILTVRSEISYLDSETDIRDSSVFGVAVSGNWQPAPFFDFSLGSRFDLRTAETDVFDTQKLQIFGLANFSPTRSTSLRSGITLVLGDEVSTATPTVAIVNSSDAIEPDNAFGGFEDRRFAYLLDANSAILELGALMEFTPQISADLGYRFIHTRADDPIDYDRYLVTMSLRYALR